MTSVFSRRPFSLAAALLSFAPLPFASTALAQDTSSGAPPSDAIVITANRTPQPLSSVLADISVIDRAAIERSGAAGLADLLARQPGIEFARNGGPGGVTSVFIRGAEARHAAVYIDGVRVDSQASGGALWEQIPLDQIDRIEVLRGPAAAVYGSDAVAGVVQLFTKRGKGAPRPTAAITLGSFGTAQGRIGVSGAADALDYSLSASNGRSSGFDARTPAATGHNPDKDGWQRSAAQGRIGWQITPDQRVEASLLGSRLRSGYDGFAPGADEQSHESLRTGTLAWQGRWSADASTRVQLGETRSSYESQPDFYRTETTLRDITLQHEQRIAGQRLTAIVERRADELFNPATAFSAALAGKRHQDAVALGWHGDFGEHGEHGVQVHLRHDRDSEFGGQDTGSLAWGWGFAPQWRVTASAASAFRAPTLYQRFSEYGNPALVPESGRNVELGLRWAGGGSEASLTAWRNKVTHLIGFGAPGPCANAFGCYVNVGRARLDGATVAGRTTLAGVTLRGSLDWHDPRNADIGTLLPRRARQLASLGAETRFGGWSFGAELQAAGRRYDDDANRQPLGGYALVNLLASTTLLPGLTLEGRVDNAADKHYELARTYATAGRAAQLTLRWAMP